MAQGKRGPNGGVIDVDDPVGRFPERETQRATTVAVRDALSFVVEAAEAERGGFSVNAGIYLDRAAERLLEALRG